MGERKRIDPKQQFSKWLARYGAIAWGVFLAAVIALLFVQPSTANACIYLVLIVTVNKAVDTVAYTRNSTIEKILLAGLDKAQIEIGLKSSGKSVNSNTGKVAESSEETEEADDEEIVDEEGGAG